MCFGRKDYYNPSEVAAKPTSYPPPQPTYAPMPGSEPKPQQQQQPSSLYEQQPVSPLSPLGPSTAPAPAQSPSAFIGELDNCEVGPPPGPPPSSKSRPPPGIAEAPGDYPSPPGPAPGSGQQQSVPVTSASATTDYAPPPGPPPSQTPAAVTTAPDHSAASAPLSGPPPGCNNNTGSDFVAPPPDRPLSHAQAAATTTTTATTAARPQHDWESFVPDTALFPPPPDIFSGWEYSPANNATEEEMEAGEAWCAEHPLCPPLHSLHEAARSALRANDPRLILPVGFRGTSSRIAPGFWEVKTSPDGKARDSSIVCYPPLYVVSEHSPLAPAPLGASPASSDGGRKSKTIYYEVAIRADSRAKETSLALGFAALPYPPFRLPGWHRASLAVHGDDGHRYTNDLAGGHSFAAPFRRGERYGIGMTFTAAGPSQPQEGKIDVEVFFTRQGRKEGSWDLHEETDADQEGGVLGLEGFNDLCCAIGTFDFVSFEVIFDPARWLYRQVQV